MYKTKVQSDYSELIFKILTKILTNLYTSAKLFSLLPVLCGFKIFRFVDISICQKIQISRYLLFVTDEITTLKYTTQESIISSLGNK